MQVDGQDCTGISMWKYVLSKKIDLTLSAVTDADRVLTAAVTARRGLGPRANAGMWAPAALATSWGVPHHQMLAAVATSRLLCRAVTGAVNSCRSTWCADGTDRKMMRLSTREWLLQRPGGRAGGASAPSRLMKKRLA